MISDRLELVRFSLIGMLLSQTADADRLCLKRQVPLGAACTAAPADLRTHTLCNDTSLSSAKARSVMCEMINPNIRPWVNELMHFALRSPNACGADKVLELPLVSAFGRTSTFCRGGEELLKIVEETSRVNRAGGEKSFKRKAVAGPFSPDAGHTWKMSTQPCNMFAATGVCMWRDCIHVHDSPPADLSSPAALSVGIGGISAAVGAGKVLCLCARATLLGLRVAARPLRAAAPAPDEETGPSS